MVPGKDSCLDRSLPSLRERIVHVPDDRISDSHLLPVLPGGRVGELKPPSGSQHIAFEPILGGCEIVLHTSLARADREHSDPGVLHTGRHRVLREKHKRDRVGHRAGTNLAFQHQEGLREVHIGMHLHGSVVTECLEIAEPGGFLVSRLREGEILSLRSDRIDERSHLEDHLRTVLARGLHGDPSQDLRNIAALKGSPHPWIGTRSVRTRNSQHHKAVLEVNLEICRFHVLIPDVQIGRIARGGDRAAHKHPASHHIPWKAHIDLVLGRAVEVKRLSAG